MSQALADSGREVVGAARFLEVDALLRLRTECRVRLVLRMPQSPRAS
jgi:hypothetical protein